MQAITTKYFGPTEKKGSRIRASWDRESFFVEVDNGLSMDENHKRAAFAMLARNPHAKGYSLVEGSLEKMRVWVLVPAVSDEKFIVGHTANGFSMLGYAGTYDGDRMTGADLRGYDAIVRVEPFDENKPEHHEFIATRAYAIKRDAQRKDEQENRRAFGN